MEQKKKIKQEHAILIVNGLPLLFHESMIATEQYELANDVQSPSFQAHAPISSLGARKLTLTVKVSTASADYAYYGVLKEAMRVLIYLFTTYERPPVIQNKKEKNKEEAKEEEALPPQFPDIELPFSKGLKVSWSLPASCAYVGFGISMACCLVESFSIACKPANNSLETWTIVLSEVNIGQFQKDYLERPEPFPTFSSPTSEWWWPQWWPEWRPDLPG